MAMKGYFTFIQISKAGASQSNNVICRTLVLPLFRGAVVVFYSPSRLGKVRFSVGVRIMIRVNAKAGFKIRVRVCVKIMPFRKINLMELISWWNEILNFLFQPTNKPTTEKPLSYILYFWKLFTFVISLNNFIINKFLLIFTWAAFDICSFHLPFGFRFCFPSPPSFSSFFCKTPIHYDLCLDGQWKRVAILMKN